MFRTQFELGGPVMYAIFAVWVVLLALVLERLLFWGLRLLRRTRPLPENPFDHHRFLEVLAQEAERNLSRIDGLSQLATSLGLFGTVLGISQAFFARGAELSLAAPEVLASGMATALFTTVAGLAVFLVGQGALILFHWWTETATRRYGGDPSRVLE